MMVAPIGFAQVRPLELALPRVAQAPAAASPPRVDFAERVSEMINDVNGSHERADAMSVDFAEGRHGDVHGTMIAMQEADIKLRLVANVRNRVIEAYREVMRMGG